MLTVQLAQTGQFRPLVIATPSDSFSALADGGISIHKGPQRCVHLPLGARAIERQLYNSSNSPYRPTAVTDQNWKPSLNVP